MSNDEPPKHGLGPRRIRRRFGARLAAAVVVGAIEFIAGFLVAMGCIGGGEVACYGPSQGVPAAPGFYLGGYLQGAAIALAGLVCLLSAAGAFGLRVLQKQTIPRIATLMIVASVAASFWGASLWRQTPADAYCRAIGAYCGDS